MLWNFGKSTRDRPFRLLAAIYPESVSQAAATYAVEFDWRDVAVDDSIEIRDMFCLSTRPCCWNRVTMAGSREGWEGIP